MPTMTTKAKRLKLSDQVRQVIEDCGETRYAICKATGLDNATLSRFMSAERGLSTTALDTLAEYLELSIVSIRKPITRK
jgi:transcriptional regulator with XRE-family HTH domain